VRAVLRTGALPAGADDETWADVPASYIPLVGQIIEQPRWFVPTVRTVWVQAVHNGSELALRLTWTDPSRSPDPAWEQWRERIVEVMEPKEGQSATGASPDALAVQFPSGAVSGRDLPYFLMGDQRTPVHLWRWSSDGTVTELTARGLDRLEPLAGGPAVSATANHADGRWTLVLTRSLESDDELRPAFRTGEAIPIAFYAWDGSNGESGRRAAIGSWYFLFLEEPASAAVIVIPIAAVLITALLGLAAVRYAQSTRRQQERAPVAGAALLDS
jgi:DMSO reductase family type II enzyme heme b subunit